MSVTALVVIAPGSEELEAVASIDTLVRGGVRVTVAAISPDGRREIVASRGVHLVADCLIDEVAERDFDVLVLPGGLPGAEHLRDSPTLIAMLRRQQARGGWRAALCAAPALVLAHHNLIGTARVTGYPGTEDKLPAAGRRQERVVVDGAHKLITSQGPGTSIDFALAILAELRGAETALQVGKGMLVR